MRALTPLALLAFATSARAAEKVELKETYLQTLPGVGYVSFDADRNPVFHLENGFYFAKTGTLAKRPESVTGSFAHYDRTGRVWLTNHVQKRTYYGTTGEWKHFDQAAVKVFDDARGNAFIFDGKSVYALDSASGTWSSQAICEKRHGEDVWFVESGKRVWLWGSREKPGSIDGMTGVWSFDAGTWTHHTTKTGLPFDSVKWMHPLADGRFVVLEDRPSRGEGRPPAFWHPDRKLADADTVVIRDKEMKVSGDPRTGIDGSLYLHIHRHNEGLIAISPKGEASHIKPPNRYEDGPFHCRMLGRDWVLGRYGEPRPVVPAGEGECIGMDRDGRFYFQRGGDGPHFAKRAVVTVAWPAKAKPGDLLHTEREKNPMRRVVKDDAGKIWAEPQYGGGLYQWHGGKWLETPVAPLYHPAWTARNMSPWNEWTWTASHLYRLHGKNGGVLAVRVRDIYQKDEPPNGEFVPPRVIRDPNFPHPAPPPGVPAGAEKAKYWLEAFLFHSGKWSGPLDIKKLFADHAERLLADFPTVAGDAAFFAFANDGTRLWAAFDGQLLTCDKTGKAIESAWPGEKPKRPLPVVALATLPGGKVLLSGGPATGNGQTLSLADGKVAFTPFELPSTPQNIGVPLAVLHWRLSKDGTFWLWADNGQGGGSLVWHLRDGKWASQKDIGAPLYETDAGVVCLPNPRWAYRFEVLTVTATEVKTQTFPREEWQLGFTDVPKGVRVWALGDALLFVDESGPKPVVRWRQMSGFVYALEPAAIDAKGAVLLGTLRGQLEK